MDLTTLGAALIFAGVMVAAAGLFRSAGREGSRVEGGGVILVGPIPIAFGSDARWTSLAIGLALALVVVMALLLLVAR